MTVEVVIDNRIAPIFETRKKCFFWWLCCDQALGRFQK